MGNIMGRIKEEISKNIIIQAYLKEYGLANCITNILINEDITNLTSINELEQLLLIHDNKVTQKLKIIKRKYMTYLIDNYFDGNFDSIYNELNIKDQDIDVGSTEALEKLNNYLKDK